MTRYLSLGPSLRMDTNENPVAAGTEAAGADGGGENMEPAPRSNTLVLVPSRKQAGGSCDFRLGSNPTDEGSIKMDQAENVYSTPPISTSADNPQGLARQQRDNRRASSSSPSCARGHLTK
jgi:hypothetical protein